MSILFVPAGIQRTRLNIMHRGATKMGLTPLEKYNSEVKYVVTELQTFEMVVKALKIKEGQLTANVVKSTWFFDSLKAGCLLPCSTYLLRCNNTTAPQKDIQKRHVYLCQKPTLLNHKNLRLVNALEIVAEEAEMKLDDAESSRALAFRKAAGALKQLDREIHDVEDVNELPAIGQHSRKIMQELIEDQFSKEIMEVEKSEWFQTVKLFCGIYGIGPKKANRLYDKGLRGLNEIHQTDIKLDKRTHVGLKYYNDLSTPVTKHEAENILKMVSAEAERVLPGVVIELMGGFCRGKATGHDVDILISHPNEGAEIDLLSKLCSRLESMDLILHQHIEVRQSGFKVKSTMDNFDKSFAILKVPKSDADEKSVKWKARRVDLIVCPFSELPFAQVGWIGSKLFNRSLRDYAKKELNFKLTSHGLYDLSANCNVSVSSQEDLFRKLKLAYLKPHERNL